MLKLLLVTHIANTVPNRQKSSKIDKKPWIRQNPGQKLLGYLKPGVATEPAKTTVLNPPDDSDQRINRPAHYLVEHQDIREKTDCI